MKKQIAVALVFAISFTWIATWLVFAKGGADTPSPSQGGPYLPPVEAIPQGQAINAPESTRGQRPLLPPGKGLGNAWLADENLAMASQARPAALDQGGGDFDVSFFFDDLESGAGKWSANGFWHIVTADSNYPNAYKGVASWWYGLEDTGTYESGSEANSGAIQTGPIQIGGDAPTAYLRFWSWEYTEGSVEYDTRKVYTSTNASDWVLVWQSNPSYDRAYWYEVLVDLSPSIGKDIYLRFEFDTVDGSYNGYRGWYVDDVGVGYDEIQLFPSDQVGYGYPGDFVSYPSWPPGDMWVENNLSVSTTFSITAQGVWTANFPTSLGYLLPGDRWHFGGYVEIPPGAEAGSYDDTTLVFTSQNTPTITQTQSIRTWTGWVHIADYHIFDDGSGLSIGDGDGLIEPGETIEISVTLKNDLDRDAIAVWGYLEPDYLMWLDSSESYGDIPAGATAVSPNRYRYTVPSWITPGTVINFQTWIYTRYIGWSDYFTVTVPHSLSIGPDSTGGGSPGGIITYNLTLQNWTGVDDQFSLTLSDHTWPTSLVPTQTGVISDGNSIPVTVTVDISAGIALGDFDVVAVEATGLGPASGFTDSAVLTTTAACFVEGESAHTIVGTLDDLYNFRPIYIYIWAFDEDNDTLYATVTGYNSQTGLWDVLADVSNVGTGVILDRGLPPIYTRIRIYMYDSEFNDEIYYTYRFWNAQCSAVSLTPDAKTKLAVPGQIITYTEQLVNMQDITDTFNLSISADWPTTLRSGTRPITQTPALPGSGTINITLQIEVPVSAQAADRDTAIIRAVSASDPGISVTAELTTVVMSQGWFQGYSENDPIMPIADFEAYLDSTDGWQQWQLTQDRHDVSSPAISAFYRDQVVYAWTRYHSNAYGFWVNEVEFGARALDGAQTISNTLLIDHNLSSDNLYDYGATVAVDPVSGNIGLAWTHEDRATVNDPWRWNVYYAVYDQYGDIVQPPTPLTFNVDTSFKDYDPVIEAFRQGQFAIAWEHSVTVGDLTGVYYAITTSQGELIKAPNELTPNVGEFDDFDPRLAQMLDGSMMVLWEAELWDNGDNEAVFARLDNAGNILTEQTALTQYAQMTTSDPGAQNLDAVSLSDGNTVIAWTMNDWVTDPTIYFAVLDQNYNIIVTPTALTNTQSTNNSDVSLTEDADGRAVLTWGDNTIYYALVDSDGAVIIWPEVYRIPHNTSLEINWKGYGNGGMPARPLMKVYLPLISR